jgi:hypothetical protein
MRLNKETSPVQSGTPEPETNLRFNIAKYILVYGLVIVAILGVVSIIFSTIWSDKTETVANVKDILTMLLPLIGTWVGTVLAFYFSKDNFKAASDSTKALFSEFRSSEEKLKTIPVKDIMIKVEDMTKMILDKDEATIKVKSGIIDAIMDKDPKKPVNRLPVISGNMLPKYMIHRSLFDSFFVKMALLGKKIEDLTLADMSKDPEFENVLTKSFGTIRENSNLAEAKHLIDNVTICQDIFITESGEPNSKVIGWITNVALAKASVI